MLAPPGGGKGTQGVRLARELGIEHISSGDVLRGEVSRAIPSSAARSRRTWRPAISRPTSW